MKIIISKIEFETAAVATMANANLIKQICGLLQIKNTVPSGTVSWGVFCAIAQERLGEENTEVFSDRVAITIPEELMCGLLTRTSALCTQLQAILPAIAGVIVMLKGIFRSHDNECNALVNTYFPGKKK